MRQSTEDWYVDIHCHILHGVDDGARDLDEARKMLVMAYKENIRIICATPHFHMEKSTLFCRKLHTKLSELQTVAREVAPDLQFVLGNEIYYCENSVDALKSGLCCPLGTGNYVLTEFHPKEDYQTMRQALYRLLMEGYRPILAHVERYLCMRQKSLYIDDLIQMGTYIQVNADSVTGKCGIGTACYTRRLLREDRIHFIATDSHNTENRAPRLKKCVAYLSQKYGRDYVRRLLWDNPMKMLHNEYI